MNALYFEGHVLLRSPFGSHSMKTVETMHQLLVDEPGWWYSQLEREEGPDELEALGDFIVTTRDETEALLSERIKKLAEVARHFDLQLLRYKIEVATIDSKVADPLRLMGPKS